LRLSLIVAAYAAAFPLVSLLAPKGTVLLLILATVIGAAAAWREGCRPIWPPRSLLATIPVFLAWSLASAAWSLDPGRTLITTAKLGALLLTGISFFAAAAALDDVERARVLKWLVFGILAALAVVAIEFAFGYQIFRIIVGETRAEHMHSGHLLPTRYNRGVTFLVVVIWPALVFLRRGPGLRVFLLFVAVAVSLVLSESFAAVVALAGGGTMWIVSRRAPAVARALMILIPILALVGSPIAARSMYEAGLHQSDWVFRNAQHRVEIWNFASEIIAGRPFLGWGLDAARVIGELEPKSETTQRPLMPLHTHNAALQVLLELGAVGGAITLVFVVLIAWQINYAPLTVRPDLQATFMALFIVAMVSFGIWQSHWLATIFGVATLARLSLPASDAAAQQRQTTGSG